LRALVFGRSLGIAEEEEANAENERGTKQEVAYHESRTETSALIAGGEGGRHSVEYREKQGREGLIYDGSGPTFFLSPHSKVQLRFILFYRSLSPPVRRLLFYI